MNKLVIASIRRSAGKTGLIIGLGKALQKKIGYLKPLGDRLIYQEKHLWDYDSALMSKIFGLKENPEEITLGFHHSKLRYMYDRESTRKKLREIADQAGAGKDLLLVEAGQDLIYGASVFLDAISLAEHLEAKLMLVISGNDDIILDDIQFLEKNRASLPAGFSGIIINKLRDLEDFKNSYLPLVKDTGMEVLGLIPFSSEFSYFSARYLAESLLAKVIAGEAGLSRIVENVFLGVQPVEEAIRNRGFKKENNLLIAGGDREDLILAAMESDFAAIVLTNNIQPRANIISQATLLKIPVLLTASDTYQVARQAENLEPLISAEDQEKISLLEMLVRKNVNLAKVF